VLILLPPSEGKTPAPHGNPPVDLAALSGADVLGPQRAAVLRALAAVSARPDRLSILGIAASGEAEAERNGRLLGEPAAPAVHIYTGVLYQAARLGATAANDPGTAPRWADTVRIMSAAWGALRPSDEIPAYRLSMGVDLPGIGPLAGAWRAPLAALLDGVSPGDLVVDCRSASYLAAWRPRPATADWVTVRGVREVAGRRVVVSHNAKHTRGVLVGHLIRRPVAPASAAELRDAAGELVDTVIGTLAGTGADIRLVAATLDAPKSRSAPATLELVTA
jgi:cytoplasmic iron level regulating protein YaaA (DUF328/UPF0246 family)